MSLFTQLTCQLISLAAIGVYLAAALLPCEPTSEERSALATALSQGAVHAAVISPPPPPSPPMPAPTPTPTPTRDRRDAPNAHAHHHEEAPPVQAAEGQGHGVHDHAAHGHGGHGEASALEQAPASADAAEGMQVRLVLKAKCVCGCDRTRSQVGGGAARLGSVVLAACVTGLPPAPAVIPEDRVLTRWVEVHFASDLVPI